MTSRAGDGSGKSVGPLSYADDLQERYVVSHGEWIKSKDQHVPETRKEYENNLKFTQTFICTRIASLEYGASRVGFLTDVTGIDSQLFDLKWLDPLKDGQKCIHLNFRGKVDGRRKSFFAELVGPGYPGLLVRRCMEYGPEDSMHNCRFCSGLWHPKAMEGGFHGQKRMKRRAES